MDRDPGDLPDRRFRDESGRDDERDLYEQGKEGSDGHGHGIPENCHGPQRHPWHCSCAAPG